MKKKIGVIFVIVIILGVIGVVAFYFGEEKSNTGSYTPSEEFQPAWKAMGVKNVGYDIEETVRAMNALEVAQCQSEDFMSYLEYVARQDFSRVAPEVLEQKKRLFPILQQLYELQKEHEELDDLWMIMRSATSGAVSFVSEVNPVGVIGSMLVGDAIGSLAVAQGIDKMKTVAFDEYEKLKDLKQELKSEIEAVKASYIQYLEDYAPVYHKYMREWDALCLKKDKAYIELYGGRPVEAYNKTQEILADYPANREALLLHAMALIGIAMNHSAPMDSLTDLNNVGIIAGENNVETNKPIGINEFYIEADNTLDNYIKSYPSRTAPALLLKGVLYSSQGEISKAMSYFEQASVEYPRQAEALMDLLDSYNVRTYLNKSVEGKYLLRLYRSTMEGFGLFSPNLQKAKYYAQNGDIEKSKEEIFNHFFRRGNQGVYDCLLSDMQYCEEHMYSSFKQILLEQSFLDVAVEPTINWTLSNKEDEIKVIINNRSDIDLENVRIFLCIHYTDMYKDEYDVQKLPSVNIIKHNDKTEIGVVKLDYENKKYRDITHIRAIAMTDDKICWIDNVDYKYMKATETTANEVKKKKLITSVKQQLLKDLNVDNNRLLSIIQKGIKVNAAVSDGNIWNDMKQDVKNLVTGNDRKLRIELPRILSIIGPVFSLNQLNDGDKAVKPTQNYLSGSHIRLQFDYEPQKGETLPFFIYSDFVDFKIILSFEGGKPSVKSVEML